MKSYKVHLILCVLIVCQSGLGLSQSNSKRTETGIVFGLGVSSLINENIHIYYKSRFNPMFDYALFYRVNYPEKRFSIKTEYVMQVFSSPYQFNESSDAIVEQGLMGVNLKAGTMNRKDPNIRAFDFHGGIGLYTIGQTRIPEPSSGLKAFEDKFGAYFGLSFNGEFSYSIPIDKYRVGMAWRFYILPNITFFNSKNVPEFYHFGNSLALISSF